jgi:hypothetical protein
MHGWIYLEATMNHNLLLLLEKRIPGIVITQQGMERQSISFPDSVRMLTMHSINAVTEDKWFRVRKGKYAGDVGLVVAIKSWGAEVLLVPRLNSLPMDLLTVDSLTPSLKRKRTAVVPQPALFNPENFDSHPRRLDNGYYTYARHTFEYGLIRKRLDFHFIFSTPSTDIPSSLFFLFRQSKHPRILASAIPRPQEWLFEENEVVIVCSSQKKGAITTVQTMEAEVDLANGEGIITASLHDLIKVFSSGDFVIITSGPFHGKTGLVVNVDGDFAHIIDKSKDGGIQYIDGSDSLQVFVNQI